MKTCSVALFCLVSTFLKAQTPCGDTSQDWHFEAGNTYVEFIVSDSSLTDSATAVELLNTMLSAFCNDIKIVGNSFTAIAKDYSLYDRSCGFTFLNSSDIMKYPLNFNIKVDFKVGKYKVRCSNFNTVDLQYLGTSIGSISWDTDLYNRKKCISKLIPLNNFEFALCRLKKSFSLRTKDKSDW